MKSCAKCKSSTLPIHSLRNGTLYYCNECLIAASRKRIRVALLSALSPRSLDLSCRLAVAVSSQRMDMSSGWCVWYMLNKHVTYKERLGLDVEAVHVRFDVGETEAETNAGAADTVEAHRIITLNGDVLASVADPTGREDLRRILIHQALAQELDRGSLDCIVLGDTADAMAATAVSRAAKGQGHLLGDVGRPKNGFAYIMRDMGKDWVAACHHAFASSSSVPTTIHGSAASDDVCAEYAEPAVGSMIEEVDEKNLHDLAGSFAAHLLQSNPGGVSNILGTVAKLEESVAGRKACALCEEVLVEDEEENRYGVCDACTVGVFGEWRNEAQAERTLALLPSTIRDRFETGQSCPS